jgi:hypothetical protein
MPHKDDWPDREYHAAVRIKAADRERKRLVQERQQRMRGSSRRWTQHVRNAIAKKYGRDR